MIDMHCHILPGVDDGARNLEESLKIAQRACEAGFKKIVATPHVLEGRKYLTCQEILMGTEKLNTALIKEGIDIEVLPGAECYIFPDLPKWVKEEKIMTVGNMKKHLLIELPMMEIPRYTDKVLFELQVMGIIPIIAHPERYKAVADQPNIVVEWANKGVLLQQNLRSITGKYGSKVADLADLLAKNNLIHFIGTDAHREESKNHYVDSIRNLGAIMGSSKFNKVVDRSPSNVLGGFEVDDYVEHKELKQNRAKKMSIFKIFMTK